MLPKSESQVLTDCGIVLCSNMIYSDNQISNLTRLLSINKNIFVLHCYAFVFQSSHLSKMCMQSRLTSKILQQFSKILSTFGNFCRAAFRKIECMVFCFQNCSDLLREKKVLVIKKKVMKFEAEGQEFAKILRLLKYGSQEKVPFWCKCSIFLSLYHV